MTRKDYVRIAEALRFTPPSPAMGLGPYRERQVAKARRVQWEMDVQAIARALEADNPLFDTARFLTACGLQAELAADGSWKLM